MKLLFSQVLVLLLMCAAGYTFTKLGKFNPKMSQLLSAMLVYLFVPFKSFSTFAQYCTVSYVKQYASTLLISSGILIVLFVVMHFVAKFFSEDEYQRKIYHYMLVIPNFGYIGFSLAESVFGPVALMDIMMFTMPLQILMHSIFYSMLTKRPVSVKSLLSPAIIGMLTGAVFGLTGLKVPDFLLNMSNSFGACFSPVSMILAGIVIAEFPLAELFRNWRVYLYSALRLLIIPISLFFVCKSFLPPEMCRSLLLTYSVPCGLSSIVFPRSVNADCRPGASNTLVNMLLCLGTIPLCMWICGVM